ncbi:Postreplication repair E3 ubiquitin-protein ligase rad18 [Penicillium diatomitis]|uniref:Postreplication repair E3 ubiquitin-protein ligase RAD18 n=1 Tax=Penicillium diatomitis TaxID=2819901 RepID=A0A9W9XCB6_9EURO|nr:Postreplication repair E3 ubiquitin-protein ligase rad18 [Penicillium diatomitis]KAJ5488674.1 Postreplication repair E3 ubiquitin-protein ligase rad18 [Penicillium diatomitis]
MEQSFDLPDSTDWLDTPVSLLAPLESSLRCQVCKDFFDTPVITSCSHTFCSLCIRRCLSTEGKCPTCRSGDQELKLRRNWLVQEILEAFQNARESVLTLAKKEAARIAAGTTEDPEPPHKKRRLREDSEDQEVHGTENGPQGVRTRSQTQVVQAPAAGRDHGRTSGSLEVVEDSQDEDCEPGDGTVACPICARRMKNEAVFAHLDSCTGNSNPVANPASNNPSSFGSLRPPARQMPISPSKAPERLPAMNYSLLKDTQLRKKFRDLGIPNWGPRQLLQRRHIEWMNLWNANCDSSFPKSKRALLRELDVWERTQGGLAPTQSSLGQTAAVMAKDFDTAQWSVNHGTDFKRLIENARKKSEAQVRSTISGVKPTSEQGDMPVDRLAEPPVEDEAEGLRAARWEPQIPDNMP